MRHCLPPKYCGSGIDKGIPEVSESCFTVKRQKLKIDANRLSSAIFCRQTQNSLQSCFTVKRQKLKIDADRFITENCIAKGIYYDRESNRIENT